MEYWERILGFVQRVRVARHDRLALEDGRALTLDKARHEVATARSLKERLVGLPVGLKRLSGLNPARLGGFRRGMLGQFAEVEALLPWGHHEAIHPAPAQLELLDVGLGPGDPVILVWGVHGDHDAPRDAFLANRGRPDTKSLDGHPSRERGCRSHLLEPEAPALEPLQLVGVLLVVQAEEEAVNQLE